MRILFYIRSMEWLGVGYLMSCMRQQGHDIEIIFDPGIDDNSYYKLDFLKYFNRWDKLIEKAVNWKPDLVAFSAVTNVYPYALEFAKRLKKHLDVPFIFGGVHPTAIPDYVLKNDEIDYVCRGEGEYALAELADYIQKGKNPKEIRNICYKENEKIFINPLRPLIHDLDSLPFPSKKYFYKVGAFRNVLSVNTARGCLFKCTYCINSFYKNKLYNEMAERMPAIRRRSPEKVIQEIKLRMEQYDIRHIYFTDEIFITDKNWLYRFLDLYKEATGGMKFTFNYHSRIMDDEIAKRLAECGAAFTGGAVETANMELKRKILKRTDTGDDVLKAAGMLRKHGVKIAFTAIFGIPHETEENRWETVRLIEKFRPDIATSFLMYPYPGTDIAEIALRDGFLSEEGNEKAKMGYSGYHRYSLMQNMDTANAETMANLLPLYNRVPCFLKFAVRIFMKMRLPRFSHFIYVITVPYTYSAVYVLRSMVVDVIRRWFASTFGIRKTAKKVKS